MDKYLTKIELIRIEKYIQRIFLTVYNSKGCFKNCHNIWDVQGVLEKSISSRNLTLLQMMSNFNEWTMNGISIPENNFELFLKFKKHLNKNWSSY